jgi:hypothetical protein
MQATVEIELSDLDIKKREYSYKYKVTYNGQFLAEDTLLHSHGLDMAWIKEDWEEGKMLSEVIDMLPSIFEEAGDTLEKRRNFITHGYC